MEGEAGMTSILPPSASKLSLALEATFVRMRAEAVTSSKVGINLAKIWDLDSYEGSDYEDLLPYVAWALNVPVWREEWSVRQKIEFIKTFLYCRLIAGTPAAIEKAISSLGISALVREKTEPYWFSVFVSSTINSEDKQALTRVVDYLKPVRTSYEIKLFASVEVEMALASTITVTKIKRIQSMATYKQVLTKQGLLALAAAINGEKLTFSKLEFGKSRYTPEDNQTALKSLVGFVTPTDSKPFERVGPSGGNQTGITVNAEIDNDIETEIGEIGLYVKRGTQDILLAVVSSPDTLISRKLKDEELLISVDIFLAKPQADVIVTGTGARLNLSFADELALLVSEIQKLNNRQAALDTRLTNLEVQG